MRALGSDWKNKPFTELNAIKARYMKKSETNDMMSFANMRMQDGEELENYIYRMRLSAIMANQWQINIQILVSFLN